MGEHFDSEVERGYSIDNSAGQGSSDAGEDGQGTCAPGVGSVTLRPPEPNPAAKGFMLEFDLSESVPVDFSVYDVTGRRVASLVGGSLQAGPHTVRWMPGIEGYEEVPPGLYFVRLAAGHEIHTAKVILLQ
jgi:hypothetical protein